MRPELHSMICLDLLITVHYCNCMAWYQVISAWLVNKVTEIFCCLRKTILKWFEFADFHLETEYFFRPSWGEELIWRKQDLSCGLQEMILIWSFPDMKEFCGLQGAGILEERLAFHSAEEGDHLLLKCTPGRIPFIIEFLPLLNYTT